MAKKESMGALWEKQSSGKTFMSGVVKINDKEVKIVCFRNDYKDSDNQPDWRIFPSQPKGE